MKSLVFALAFFLITAYACQPETTVSNESAPVMPATASLIFNPLDSILGDKLLYKQSGQIRRNNFGDLLKITLSNLEAPSQLYAVQKMDRFHYILHQKNSYSMARAFDLLLETDSLKVVRYIAFQDNRIADWKRNEKGWLLMCDDWENANYHWQKKGRMKILQLDDELREIWKYEPAPVQTVCGRKISADGDKTICLVNLVLSSHMVFDIIRLELDGKGKCTSAVWVGGENTSGDLPEKFIREVFPVQ